jgi:hypothetical protein
MTDNQTSPRERSRQITSLCEQNVRAMTPAPGAPDWTPEMGRASKALELMANGILFHELSHEELQTTCVALTSTLMTPGMSTMICADHLWFWAWIGELLCTHYVRNDDEGEREITELLGVCVRVALADMSAGLLDWQTEQQLKHVLPTHWLQLRGRSHVILTYLAFPTLEGFLKLKCSTLVDLAGKVLKPFDVQGRDEGERRFYGTTKGSRDCSNVRDLLFLVYQEARPALAGYLDRMRVQIERLVPAKHGFTTVFDWRNSSLHGKTTMPTIGGTILNLAILIALDRMADRFEEFHRGALRRVERLQLHRGLGIPDDNRRFYPP